MCHTFASPDYSTIQHLSLGADLLVVEAQVDQYIELDWAAGHGPLLTSILDEWWRIWCNQRGMDLHVIPMRGAAWINFRRIRLRDGGCFN